MEKPGVAVSNKITRSTGCNRFGRRKGIYSISENQGRTEKKKPGKGKGGEKKMGVFLGSDKENGKWTKSKLHQRTKKGWGFIAKGQTGKNCPRRRVAKSLQALLPLTKIGETIAEKRKKEEGDQKFHNWRRLNHTDVLGMETGYPQIGKKKKLTKQTGARKGQNHHRKKANGGPNPSHRAKTESSKMVNERRENLGASRK